MKDRLRFFLITYFQLESLNRKIIYKSVFNRNKEKMFSFSISVNCNSVCPQISMTVRFKQIIFRRVVSHLTFEYGLLFQVVQWLVHFSFSAILQNTGALPSQYNLTQIKSLQHKTQSRSLATCYKMYKTVTLKNTLSSLQKKHTKFLLLLFCFSCITCYCNTHQKVFYDGHRNVNY